MEEKEKEYSGFWKNAGCILSVIAIFGILAVIVIAVYMFAKGF
ncbi:hypothetical protein [Flagellimonas sp. S3867]|nr:hypothetical protein [Flagellimonas sp. S3867]